MEQGPEVFRPEINKNKTGARKGAEIGQEQEQKHELPGSQHYRVCRHPLPPLGQEHHISKLLPLEKLLEVGQQQGMAAGAHTSLLAGSRLDQATSESWINLIEIIPSSTETRDHSVLGRSERQGCLCLSLVILVLPPELDRQGAIIGGEKILHTGKQLSLSV